MNSETYKILQGNRLIYSWNESFKIEIINLYINGWYSLALDEPYLQPLPDPYCLIHPVYGVSENFNYYRGDLW